MKTLFRKSTSSALGRFGGIASLFALGACAAAGGGEGAETLTIAGDLSSSTTVASMSQDFSTFALENYKVRCVTLSGSPQSGEGSVNSNGEFSLELAEAIGVPVGCFILEGSTIKAIMSFENSDTGMNGTASQEGSYVPGSGAKKLILGLVEFNPDTGVAKVSKANIVIEGGSEGTVNGTWENMDGNWTIKTVDNAPQGYIKPCAAGTPEEQCEGPIDGMTIHLAQYSANDGIKDHTGLAIWENSTKKAACFGSSGGEGVDLPNDWTGAADSELTQPLNGLVATLPDPALVPNNQWQGIGTCGSSASTCDAVTNADNWGHGGTNNGGEFTDAQCQFMCVVNNSWSYFEGASGCGVRNVEVSWNTFNTWLQSSNPSYSGGWQNVDFDGASSDQNTYANESIRIRKEPSARFMINELLVNGSLGTMSKSESWNYQVCTGVPGQENECSNHATCTFTQVEKLTILQNSSSEATFELIQDRVAASGNHSNCSLHEEIKSEKWFFKAIKNSSL